MRNDKIVPGMVLVILGLIILLHNFGYIHFYWYHIWHLWPIFLVIGGVNLLFAGNRSAWATILKIAVIIAGFAILVFSDFSGSYRWWPQHYFRHQNRDNDDASEGDDDTSGPGKMVKISGTSEFHQPYDAGIRTARLNVSGGGTNYRLKDTTGELFKAVTVEHRGRYELSSHREDSVYVMDFTMKDHKNWGLGNENNNSAVISLNTKPVWEISINAGATDLDFDLSKFKVRSVQLKGGAAAFLIRLGEPLSATNVTVSTGASDVTIEVPRDAACSVQTDSGLSSNTFDGFNRIDDSHYETAGFAAAHDKVTVQISGGVSSFKVHRY